MCIRDRLVARPRGGRPGALRAGGAAAGRRPGSVPSDVPGPSGPARDSGAADRGAGRRRPGRPPLRAEPGHTRGLATVFGQVRVTRIAYRARGRTNLHPADGELNLPDEEYSHGLRRLAAVESARGSFDGAVEAIERGTGQQVGKRQVEQLAADPRPTRTASTANGNPRPAPAVTHSCCPATARVSCCLLYTSPSPRDRTRSR